MTVNYEKWELNDRLRALKAENDDFREKCQRYRQFLRDIGWTREYGANATKIETTGGSFDSTNFLAAYGDLLPSESEPVKVTEVNQ